MFLIAPLQKEKKMCSHFFNVALAATLANLMSWVIECAD